MAKVIPFTMFSFIMDLTKMQMSRIATIVCASFLFAQGIREIPEAVFYNGKVITVDPSNGIKEAFAIKGDKFFAVGTTRDMRALAGARTQLVDLKGKAVMPG